MKRERRRSHSPGLFSLILAVVFHVGIQCYQLSHGRRNNKWIDFLCEIYLYISRSKRHRQCVRELQLYIFFIFRMVCCYRFSFFKLGFLNNLEYEKYESLNIN